MKMSKEEAKAYDNNPNISAIFAPDTDDSSEDSDYPMISMNSSTTKTAMRSSHSKTSLGTNYQIDCLVVLDIFQTYYHLYFHFGHLDILSKQFSTYT